MIEDIANPELIYADDEPDINVLATAYAGTIADVDSYLWQCRRSYDERRNYWPGKTDDLRKNGPAAFPWPGASDIEAFVIEERIQALVTNSLSALGRAHIRAYGVNSSDITRAQVVSSFLKWLVTTGIPNFANEMERSFNHLFEKDIAVSYVGWQRELRTIRQIKTMDEIAQESAEFAEMIEEGEQDDALAQILMETYPGLKQKRAEKALRDLRAKGEAEICFARPQVDRPTVRACSPDGDVFFPPYCRDIQKAPYIFLREWLTAQEILKKVSAEGWDSEWANYVIQYCRGLESDRIDGEYGARHYDNINPNLNDKNELVMVVYAYQRLIDDDDGSEGIYLTIFQPDYTGQGSSDAPAYALHELIGSDDYPFVVTKLSLAEARLYDVKTIPEKLRGSQRAVKVERDGRIDRSSLSTNPPVEHPAGRPPTQIGPGAMWGYRRRGEVGYAQIPQQAPGSIEVEATMLRQADDIVGLNYENPSYAIRQQYYVDKTLRHARDTIKMAWKNYQRFGPDQMFFEVVGATGPQQIDKGDPDQDFDIFISFDTQWNDPDSAESKLKSFGTILPFDKMGRIDVGKYIEALAYAIDPGMASFFIQPADQAQQAMVKAVTDDVSKIFAGIEVGAQPNGAQVAMQVIQQWMQQPDIQQRYASDEGFKDRVDKYVGQYQMQMEQTQNAEIGRLGTAPAAFQGTNVGAQQ